MQKRAKTEGIGGGIPPNKICHRIFAFSGTLVIFKQCSKHATPVGLYIVLQNSELENILQRIEKKAALSVSPSFVALSLGLFGGADVLLVYLKLTVVCDIEKLKK